MNARPLHPISRGAKFGRWTLTGETARDNYKHPRLVALAVCICGTRRWVRVDQLKSGASRSCGCGVVEAATKHGGRNTRLYTIWRGMRARCLCPTDRAFKWYGGKGVAICSQWSEFEAFKEWALANGYRDDLSIDRFPDTNGNYEPVNCRWATSAEQNRNRRDNIAITAFGETKCIAEWLRDPRCAVRFHICLQRRLDRGMSPEDAITAPTERRAA